ncbi:adenylyl-sulfate kinase [Vulgatibacter incomptus]|uniref:Low-complexity acidic protein n=1 Tax=Vulgatibacter incomptus TaxID=1391653 RepID=A0A0K1PDY6_9BACT|nr:adenylyl-sulfate kinase [Vulgatibacter incomptus]AKU91748.1 Low-complexity acidic protein [Vulgatibacter incomptus]
METQQGFTLWLTGMSGAGKSTLASYVARRFPLIGRRVELLDMSELEDLAPEGPDASNEIRDRNVRLLGWVARLLTRSGAIPVVASVSPHREVRDEQRRAIGRFVELFVDSPFETLLERDTRGIYRRALAGELQDVVGVQSPYEPPVSPEIQVDMGVGGVEAVAAQVFDRLANLGYITQQDRDVLVNGSAPPVEIQAVPEPPKAKKAKAKPVAAIQMRLPVEPADASQAAGAKARPAKASKPAEARAAPAKASKQAESAKPAAAAKASKPAAAKEGSAKVEKPAAAKAAPAKAAKPAVAKTPPAKASKPAEAKAAPAKASKPADAKAASAKASKPAEAKTAPAKAPKPAEAKAAPAKASKPAAAKAAPAKASKPAAAKSAPAKAAKPAAEKAAAKTPPETGRKTAPKSAAAKVAKPSRR